MYRLLHHGLCAILSAALLLTNGLPMAVQHAHPVGKNLSHHTHDTGFASHGSMSPHREHLPVIASASLTEVTEHIHLLWLGMEFTLPAPKGHEPDKSVSPSGACVLARLNDQCASELDSTPSPCVLVDDLFLSEAFCVISAPAAEVRPRELASLPLCDTARHARSGVQLI